MRKQVVAYALTGVLALGVVGCGQQAQTTTETKTETTTEAPAQTTTEQTKAEIKWTDAKDADEAAKGAKLEKFGVFKMVTFNDTTYVNPKFSYADGVAQAKYDAGATELVVRKGGADRKAPLSDRDKTSFAATWTKVFDGVEVHLYGPEKDKAVVMDWIEDNCGYGVTYQGTGGEEVTLDNQDVTALVSAIRKANVKEEEKKDDDSQQQEQSNNNQTSNNQSNNSNKQNSSNQNNNSNQNNQSSSDGDAEADAQAAARAKYNALASMGMTDVQDVSVAWMGHLWLVSYTWGDSFYEVELEYDGTVIGSHVYQNGVEVKYSDDENHEVINQDEIDEAGEELRNNSSDEN